MENVFKRARLILIVLCILFGLAATGCEAVGNPIAGPNPVIELKFPDYTLRRDNGQGRPGAKVDAFRATDRKIHFEVVVQGDIPPGTKSKWVFTAVDTKAAKNQVIDQGEVVLDFGNSLLNPLNGALESPTDWSAGTYKADIFFNDQLVFTFQYKVQ